MNFKFWQRSKPLPALEVREKTDTSDVGTGFLSLLYGKSKDNIYDPEQIAAVFNALEQISGSIAQLPINIYNYDGECITHPLKDIFYDNEISKYNMLKQLIWDLYSEGNGYIYITRNNIGSPIKLTYLKPSQVQVYYNENNYDSLYYYASGIIIGKIEPINMIHLYKHGIFNKENKSSKSYGNKSMNLARETDSSAYQYFRSGCNVSGILKFLSSSTPQQRNELLASWQTNVGKNRNGVAIVPNNVDYIKLGSDGSTAQLLESRQYNLQEIARYFNISPIMLGDLSHASYSTLEMVMTQFVTVTLQPIIVLLEEELNRKLVSRYESIRLSLDETFLIKYDKKTEAEYYKGLVSSGILTVNEARQKLGFATIDGADRLIIPFTDINQNTINADKNLSSNENE